MAQTIHVAELVFDDDGGERTVTFASLDGESYLPVTCKPSSIEDAATLAELFDGKVEDGVRWQPMRYARNALRVSWWPESAGCKSAEHETIELS